MELFGFGQRVDLKHDMHSTGVVTFFNHKGNEKFSVKLKREDFDKFWEVKDFVTDIMKEHGRDQNFWSILSEKLNEQYGVIEFMNSKREAVKTAPKQSTKKQPKTVITDSIPQVEMTASYATILFKGNIVDVVFTNNQEEHTVTYKYRKSWSNRKYIDNTFDKSGISPAWDFRYGWEWVGA